MVNVVSSRILLQPADLERSRAFYRDDLGLAIYREFGSGPERGTVFFLGGGYLELSGRSGAPMSSALRVWLQVPDIAAAHTELADRGVPVLRPPLQEPWGLFEMWIADPDGLEIVLVEVPADHPIRYRP